jgi:hypothetical protein
LSASAFIPVLAFILMGTPGGHDFYFHATTWIDVASQHAIFPRWAVGANSEFGDARLIFYPPLSWWLGGNLCKILPLSMAPGVYVLICTQCASIAMYLLAREFMPRRESLIAGAAYALSPYFLFDIYPRGAYAELLAMALFPASLLFLLQICKSGWHRSLPLFSVSLSLIWLADIPLALVSSLTLASLALVLFVSSPNVQTLFRLTVASLLALGLAGFYWIPAVSELAWNNPDRLATGDLTIGHFWLPPTLIAILSISILAAIYLAACVYRTYKDRSFRLLLPTLAILSLFMISPLSLAIWKLPILYFMDLPFRWLAVLSPLFAFAVAFLWSSRPRLVSTIAVVALAALLALPGLVQKRGSGTSLLKQIRAALANGQGYEGVVFDWNPREFSFESDPRSVPLASFDQRMAGASSSRCGAEDLQILSWQPEHKIITTNCPVNSLVRYHLAYFPRWKISVNGKSIPAAQDADGLLESPLPGGVNRIEISFATPAAEIWGTVCSFLSLMVCAGLAFILPRTGPVD